jgi:hemerythrin-like domain-containing protein
MIDVRLGDRDAYERELEIAVANDDPTAVLLAEHAWLRSILAELDRGQRRDTSADRPGLRSQLEPLRGLLELHIRKEEDLYFPAVQSLLGVRGEQAIADMYGEHDAIRIRYDQFADALHAGQEVAHELSSLEKSLVVHFDNEEELIFEEVSGRLTRESGRELVASMQRIEETQPAAPSGG